MRWFFLTLDLEDWFHLDYLKEFDLDCSIELIPSMTTFLDLLDELGIKMTVFALSDMARRHKELLKDIVSRGHEVGSHGWNHELLYLKDKAKFRREITTAKAELEDILGQPVWGYRAACYSIDNEKLDIIQECGYRYDSSYIRFAAHPLYGKVDLGSFSKVDDLVYERNGFYEFEIPTVLVLGKQLPISGGGYFRLFPWWVFRTLFGRYQRQYNNFVFYIHPFEVVNQTVDLPRQISPLQRFRFSVGRKGNLDKLRKFLTHDSLRSVRFETLSTYIRSHEDG